MGVLLTYASAHGHVFLDRARALPQPWTNAAARCARAGMPPARVLATKPQLAQQRLARAFEAAVPAAWVTGDGVYGENRPLRAWLEARRQA